MAFFFYDTSTNYYSINKRNDDKNSLFGGGYQCKLKNIQKKSHTLSQI
ncbi:hypothetical protein FUAX_18210 [Fulvitalea axinellae]|uniref:Uncharacterized protein n=1 Tax=Fulvitalea axinellae TaxID=1182444 RepID=A0AAU9CBA7_9BACT|nr:hypothetical protein FUAX_18210 [Fulvitalea axinellae]